MMVGATTCKRMILQQSMYIMHQSHAKWQDETSVQLVVEQHLEMEGRRHTHVQGSLKNK